MADNMLIARIDTFTKEGRYVKRGQVVSRPEAEDHDGNISDNYIEAPEGAGVAVEVSAIAPTGPNPSAWGPLRRALAEGDHAATLAVIKAGTRRQDGCWIWVRSIKDGYPVVDVGGKSMAVHRLSIEAHLGAPLGSQAAHHLCAIPACVNPEHLVPVTHAENTAEMLARQAYIARIRELEEALAEVAPHHELLARLPVA